MIIFTLMTWSNVLQVYLADPASNGSYSLQPKPAAYVGPGRPLGVMFDAEDNLYVCNSALGLMRLSGYDKSSHKFSRLELSAAKVSADSRIRPGEDIMYADDLDIASDGTVFWSTATDLAPYRYMRRHDMYLIHTECAVMVLPTDVCCSLALGCAVALGAALPVQAAQMHSIVDKLASSTI